MSRKIEDVSNEEILTFRSDIENIITSNKLTMPEKSEKIKNRIKDMLKDFSYLDLFNALKASKISKNPKELNGILYEEALDELLAEKKKELTNDEIDELLDHFQAETNKTRKFIKETNASLLTEDEIKNKSKILTDDDFNFKRLAVAADEGSLSNEQKSVFENEGKKVEIIEKESDLKVLEKYEEDLSRELSDRIKTDPKKL